MFPLFPGLLARPKTAIYYFGAPESPKIGNRCLGARISNGRSGQKQGVILKRVPLAIMALVIAAAACQEIATAPQSAADAELQSSRESNPPPPPIDTGATGTVGGIPDQTQINVSAFDPNFSILTSPGMKSGTVRKTIPVYGGFASFTIPVTYLLNSDGSSGYLHFHDAPDIDADASGMVKYRGPEPGGVFEGKGNIYITVDGGTLRIDLSSVSQTGSSFEACPQAPVFPSAARGDSSCFRVQFDEIYFNDVLLVGESVTFFPSCDPNDPEDNCNIID